MMSMTVARSAYGQGPSTVTGGRVGAGVVGLGLGRGVAVAGTAVVGARVGTGAAESWAAVSHPVSRTPAASPSTIAVRTGIETSSRSVVTP
jgi:hypothetical protein